MMHIHASDSSTGNSGQPEKHYAVQLSAVKHEIEKLPLIGYDYEVTQTPAHTGPWLLWLWISERGESKYRGISSAIYFISEDVGRRKQCLPGVYLALQHGTHGIDPVFSKRAVSISRVNSEVAQRARGLKHRTLDELRSYRGPAGRTADILKPPFVTYEDDEGKAVLNRWRDNFIEQNKYLQPAQYTFGIVCLTWYPYENRTLKVTDDDIVRDLASCISAMNILGAVSK
ncbi:MAG: hypothetical protein ACYC7L_17785 [Nitrospirota bacterium]